MSADTKLNKIKSLKEQSTGENNPMYNKRKSEKAITAIKKANSKEIIIDEVRYSSIAEASKSLNVGVTTISFRLDSPNYPNYIRLHPKNVRKGANNKKRKVSIDGVEYKSIKEASVALKCSTTKVSKRCNADWCTTWYFV